MGHERNDREKQQQVNQATGNVEHQETTKPQNKQEQGNYQKWSESHFRLLSFLIVNDNPFNESTTFISLTVWRPYPQNAVNLADFGSSTRE
jgi:hypothetical protein